MERIMTDKKQNPLNDERMRQRAFARWENEGGATALRRENSTIKVVIATPKKKKPPLFTGKK